MKGIDIGIDAYKDLFGDNFYRLGNFDDRNNIVEGQLVWANVIHPIKQQCVLTIEENFLDVDKCNWKLTKFVYKDYKNKQYFNKPIPEYNLEADEVVYPMKGKFRPCIVLSISKTIWFNKNYPETFYLVLPLYTVKDRHEQDWIVNIQALKVDYAFYFPPETNGNDEECIGLFYNIQTIKNFEDFKIMPFVSKSNQNKPVFLTKIMYRLLLIHLFKYLHIKDISMEGNIIDLNKDLSAFSELIIEEYNNQINN